MIYTASSVARNKPSRLTSEILRILQSHSKLLEEQKKCWKAFSDVCQDLEEERVEFMKDNVWAYVNAVSTVYVSNEVCAFQENKVFSLTFSHQ